jgi:hypothetical protein
VVGGAIRWALDADVATDFLCISPKAGDVINTAAAKQLMNTKRLVFNVYSSFSICPSHKALAPIEFGVRRANARTPHL